MSKEIERLRPTSVEEIVEGAALLSTCFPFIGGIVSGIALHTVAALRWERLVDFLQSVEEQLEHLHLEDISADQEEIVTEVLERVIRERSKEKSDCYRRIFLNAVSDESLEYGEVIEKVKLVEQLTPNHIRLLSVLRDPRKADEDLGGKIAKGTSNYYKGSQALFLSTFFSDWSNEPLRRTWDDLYRLNILTQEYPSGIDMCFSLEGLSKSVSNFGRNFLAYVLDSDSPIESASRLD